jgi:pilus assembly protein CpaC
LNFTVLNKAGQGVFAQATGSLATAGLAQQSGLGGGLIGGNSVPVVPGVVAGNGGFNNLPAMIDNGQINLAISALRNLNYAKLLAEPTVAVINGHTANFHAGGEYPVPELTSGNNNGNTLQGFAFKPYGVNVSFTPYITDRDRIRLEIDANITALSNITSTSGLGGAQVQGFNARRLRTTVDLRDGQTLAAAGLIQNDWTGEAHRVPLFGDLPIIGRLAGFDHVSAGEQELVILVTPELTHPIDCKTKLPLPGSDMFEPTDIEYYLLGRLESHRNIDFRSPIMTDWQRLRNYRNFETQFIMGPSGYTVP